MLEESEMKGEEVMPNLAQALREEGRGEGHLFGKQEALIMLLSTRFQLTADEHQFIREVKTLELLDAALKMIVTAGGKEEIFAVLKGVTG